MRNRISFWKASLAVLVLTGLVLALVLIPSSRTTVRGDSTGFHGLKWAPGSSAADRQLLGLFSTDFGNFKSAVNPSEWGHVRNVRYMIRWSDVEPRNNQFDWSKTDAMINSALSLGIDSILLTLTGYIPDWAQDPSRGTYKELGPPKNVFEWQEFCTEIADRYKDYVDYYQIWQEAGWDNVAYTRAHNEGIVYFDGDSRYEYMPMLRAGYHGVKSADPTAMVFSSSLICGLQNLPSDLEVYDTLLAGSNQDLSLRIDSDKDIVAERPMYFNYHDIYPGGHVESGRKEAANTWYLAEGATHPGLEEWICIENPSDSAANINITYMFPGGETQNQSASMPSHARLTISVNEAVGPYKDVSAKVEADQEIIVERPMYFNYHGWCTGGHVDCGVTELSDTWYIAEGTTHGGFEEWISINNPGDAPADVTITYMFREGPNQTQALQMEPHSRRTVLVNEIVGPARDVSAKVEANQDIIVERPMYFHYHGAWTGGHVEVGTTRTSERWFISEGTTRSNEHDGSFEEWISINNPGDETANITLTYMFMEGGTQQQALSIPPRSRDQVLVNNVVGPDKDVSVQVDSDQPVIVERPMYFDYHRKWAGGHVEIGNLESGTTWFFAEGTTRVGFEEWLTLQNPNSEVANATLTFMFTDGQTQQKQVALPPASRTTVDINNSVSLATICDAVSIHPYYYPQDWFYGYQNLRNMCALHGYPNEEVVVTEIGWPHNAPWGDPEFQRQAIGDLGVGQLFGAGCRKIWIYNDLDKPPGEAWDAQNDGMFYHGGSPTPAWNEYKRWQSVLTDYPNLPGNLW